MMQCSGLSCQVNPSYMILTCLVSASCGRLSDVGHREMTKTRQGSYMHAKGWKTICWPLRGWKTCPKKEHHPTEWDGQIGTNHSLPLERGALFNRFFGKPAHGPPRVAGGASGPMWGCRDESRTDNPDLDLRHVFDRNNQKTDLT